MVNIASTSPSKFDNYSNVKGSRVNCAPGSFSSRDSDCNPLFLAIADVIQPLLSVQWT